MKILFLSLALLIACAAVGQNRSRYDRGTIKGGKQLHAHSRPFAIIDGYEAHIDTFLRQPGVQFLYRHPIEGGYLIIYNITKDHKACTYRGYFDGEPDKCMICGAVKPTIKLTK